MPAPRAKGRRAFSIAAVAALTAAGPLGGAQSAGANASGCHGELCIDVPGHGDWVGRVTVKYTLWLRQEVEGHFSITRNTHVVSASAYQDDENESYWHSHTWSAASTFDRHLTPGDRICGKFAPDDVAGDYVYSEACETVGS